MSEHATPTLPGIPTGATLMARWALPDSSVALILLDMMNVAKGAWEHCSWLYNPATGEMAAREKHADDDPMGGFWKRVDTFKGIKRAPVNNPYAPGF